MSLQSAAPAIDSGTVDGLSDETRGQIAASAEPRVYDSSFWLCYAANCCLMVSVSLLFRYSDFVTYMGGSEMDLGLIVGVGMIGALVFRFVQGVGIDRFGPRNVWLFSLSLFIASALSHLLVTTVHGPGVYCARVMMMTSLAGAFGASITYVSLRAPESRMGETIGTLGSSGFVGLAMGPVLGDWLFAGAAGGGQQVKHMFMLAATMALVALILTAIATRHTVRRKLRKRPPMLAVVRRYHPGMILVMGIAMGLAVGLPHTFLRAYAAELHIDRIKFFFIVYATVAFLVRIGTRRWADEMGVRPLIVWGTASAAVSMLLYLVVRDAWTLAIPAVAAGIAHAFLFPAVVSGGNSAFPVRYRGIATTLILAMFDIGNLVGQPMIGGIVRASRTVGLPPYPTMFVVIAVILTVCATTYAWRGKRPLQGEV